MFLFLCIFNFLLSFSLSKDVIHLDNNQLARDLFTEETPLRLLKTKNQCKKDNKENTTLTFDCNDPEINCTLYEERIDCNDNKTECKCKPDFANVNNCTYKCEYKRKKQLTAFLLELFVGFGAGHFYRASYLIASLKLVAFLFGIYIICLFPVTAKCISECCDCDCLVVVVSLFFFACSVGLAFWFVFDLVRFGKNKLNDKYGFKLKPW